MQFWGSKEGNRPKRCDTALSLLNADRRGLCGDRGSLWRSKKRARPSLNSGGLSKTEYRIHSLVTYCNDIATAKLDCAL
jgi:hypothetical protein